MPKSRPVTGYAYVTQLKTGRYRGLVDNQHVGVYDTPHEAAQDVDTYIIDVLEAESIDNVGRWQLNFPDEHDHWGKRMIDQARIRGDLYHYITQYVTERDLQPPVGYTPPATKKAPEKTGNKWEDVYNHLAYTDRHFAEIYPDKVAFLHFCELTNSTILVRNQINKRYQEAGLTPPKLNF